MDMAKHIHNYFCDKINKLRGDMEQTGNIKAEEQHYAGKELQLSVW